jgi:hypothetical protein
MLDRVPSVVFISKHNELKLYQGNIVYLNDGDNFELRFFNPLNFKIGVEIMFNGIRKGDGYLVLNPGQDLTLDRFLDEQRKMLFETYTINGNNKEAVEAIEKNGVISFNFYKEYYSNFNQQKHVNINYDFPPISKGPQGTKGIIGNFSYSSTSNYSPGVYTLETDQSFVSGQMCFSNLDSNIDYSKYVAEKLETGRIEKGEISDQRLKGINMDFASKPFHSMTYKLMPYSTMNREIGEIRQYCSECGYRLRKSSWKYCPSCGNKLS